MQKLNIGQISPLNLPVPPKKYGGTEKIIYFLCEELTKKGHKVFLFGSGDSKVSCPVIEIVKEGLWTDKTKKEHSPYYGYQMAMIAQKAQELKLDIIHDHLGPISLALYSHEIRNKILHTIHIPMKSKDRAWAYKKLNARLVSISNNQRKPAPDLNYLATVYNGLDIENFTFNKKPKDYFLWVGELSPRKGIREVLKIANRTNINLLVAGRIPPLNQKNDYLFFKKYVAPLLNKKRNRYVGELTIKQLKKYYRNAIAFLNPLQWEEPFGLTTIEAMACGTPVIAFKRGAMPELIENKKTGFVIPPFNKNSKIKPNYSGFIEAIKNISSISRFTCRKRVEENFSIERMVGDYEKVYYKMIQK